MKWSEYYERYDGWEESAQYSWLSAISDFGPVTSPASQIADCVSNVDEKTANKILRLAASAGVRFSVDEIIEILENTDLGDETVRALIRSTDESAYSAAQLENLLGALYDEAPALQLIDRICLKPNHFVDTELVSLIDALCDEERSRKLLLSNTTKFSEEALADLCDLWVDEDVIRAVARRSGIPYSAVCEEDEESWDDPSFDEPQPKGGVGPLGLLLAGVAAFGSATSGKHRGRCDGDCAHCPPHYGYRYGRWYYGHGHMHGCQFGGNRRGGGD